MTAPNPDLSILQQKARELHIDLQKAEDVELGFLYREVIFSISETMHKENLAEFSQIFIEILSTDLSKILHWLKLFVHKDDENQITIIGLLQTAQKEFAIAQAFLDNHQENPIEHIRNRINALINARRALDKVYDIWTFSSRPTGDATVDAPPSDRNKKKPKGK